MAKKKTLQRKKRRLPPPVRIEFWWRGEGWLWKAVSRNGVKLAEVGCFLASKQMVMQSLHRLGLDKFPMIQVDK